METPLIDWFTVIAQIINFLILVGLLKYFLYGKIVEAMRERERKIAETVARAEQREKEAEELRQRYDAMLAELHEQRDTWLREAKEEVERSRQSMLRAAREEVDLERAKWLESLELEKQSFARQFQHRLAVAVQRIAERILKDLADSELQEQAARLALRRLRELPADAQARIRDQFTDGNPQIHVETALPVTDEFKRLVENQLRELFPHNPAIVFSQNRDLICGLRIRTAGYQIGWSIADYLNEVSRELTAAILARQIDEVRALRDANSPGVTTGKNAGVDS